MAADVKPRLIDDQLCVAVYNANKLFNHFYMANYKFNPNKPGNFQWQSVDDGFLMVVD